MNPAASRQAAVVSTPGGLQFSTIDPELNIAYVLFGHKLEPDIIANIGGELKVIGSVWMAIKVPRHAVPMARPLGTYAGALG